MYAMNYGMMFSDELQKQAGIIDFLKKNIVGAPVAQYPSTLSGKAYDLLSRPSNALARRFYGTNVYGSSAEMANFAQNVLGAKYGNGVRGMMEIPGTMKRIFQLPPDELLAGYEKYVPSVNPYNLMREIRSVY
jgi:hypothetical protein